MNNPPEFDFDNSKPRNTDVPFPDFIAWCEAHAADVIFAVTVKEGFYRVNWKPGEQIFKKTVDTPSPV